VFDTTSPGSTEAIARLGGPFVHFFEYVTPEEAGQQLGRVVVGAPSQGERSYDLEVTFTRFKEGKREHHTVQIAEANESHILDVPWAYDGQVHAERWEAEMRITWRGETLVYSHQSKPLFPSVHTWRSLVYDEHKEPVLIEQVMDEVGWIKEGLDWQPHVQNPTQVQNTNQPHAVLFFKEYLRELRAGSPLAAFLSTTVISPDERDVIIWYKSSGLADLYLNGQRIEESPEVGESEDLPSFFYPVRETEVVRLCAGKNSLVVHARPSLPEGLYWFFGGAFVTPDGDVMFDLSFE
jgi:hypothetical protein